MEYIDDHNNLRKYSEEVSDLKAKPLTKEKYNLELTPSANRKNSEAVMQDIKLDINQRVKKGAKILIMGICGGQSSGKSKISAYLKKHINNSTIISEKDFFIGNRDRRKSLAEEKLKYLDINEDDEYPNTRKHRLVETNSLKCFDFDALKNSLISLKLGNATKFQSWDKEKSIMYV
jgi:uridine kinase